MSTSLDARTLAREVAQRLQREGRWAGQIERERDEMIQLAKKSGLSAEDAQVWVYSELDRLYPPPGDVTTNSESGGGDSSSARTHANSGTVRDTLSQPAASESGRIQGLADIPAAWPTLPDNASLQAEISWVQSQRLRIVEEKSTGATVVYLDRAGSPAPSWAALGWLETSIRSYAKYVDVVAKSLATAQDDVEQVRRERMAIAEIDALLLEMYDDAAGK